MLKRITQIIFILGTAMPSICNAEARRTDIGIQLESPRSLNVIPFWTNVTSGSIYLSAFPALKIDEIICDGAAIEPVRRKIYKDDIMTGKTATILERNYVYLVPFRDGRIYYVDTIDPATHEYIYAVIEIPKIWRNMSIKYSIRFPDRSIVNDLVINITTCYP